MLKIEIDVAHFPRYLNALQTLYQSAAEMNAGRVAFAVDIQPEDLDCDDDFPEEEDGEEDGTHG